MAKMMSGAAGAAQAAGDEVRTFFKAQSEKMVADMDLVRKEEVEALKALTRAALERVDALEKRVADLENKGKPGA
jgi:BMFP domain-containing protein YqiC